MSKDEKLPVPAKPTVSKTEKDGSPLPRVLYGSMVKQHAQAPAVPEPIDVDPISFAETIDKGGAGGGVSSATSFRESVNRKRIIAGLSAWAEEEFDKVLRNVYMGREQTSTKRGKEYWQKHPAMVAMTKRLADLHNTNTRYREASLKGFLNFLTAYVEWTEDLVEFPIAIRNGNIWIEAGRGVGNYQPMAAIEFIDETVMDIRILSTYARACPAGHRSGARFVIESLYPDRRAPGVMPAEL